MNIIDREKINTELAELKSEFGSDRSALMPILQTMQDKYGYLSDMIMQQTAFALDIHPAEVEGVASFYSFYNTREKQGEFCIKLCRTISCDMEGKSRVARQLENELGIKFGETSRDRKFSLEYTNCLGMCDQGPAMLINDRLFAKVTPEKVHQIISDCKAGFIKSEFPAAVPNELRKKGPITEHGVGSGDGLKSALNMSRTDIISAVRESRLKGRGGAGFPTATKWQLAAAAIGEKKFVVCNADEGEPGTFKDRYLLYDQTDLFLEGMTIAAYAIGASTGYIYLRGEYLYMKSYLEDVIQKRRDAGLLGENANGKEGFSFDIHVRMGAGAYVCGEETALIESLEGKRGEPRNKPPFPVNTGFQNQPTIVNNVETFVDVALICAKGAAWFAAHGTEGSSGTKLFSISGDCENPGIYELPFGISVAEMLKEVGGENAKAVQVGGASGSCIPRSDFNRTIGYEDISSGGSVMVFGPQRDMLHVAKNFMEFFVEESCGQCTPCRDGNVKLLEGVELLEEGKCSIEYLNELVSLGETMQIASKCGLGQTSPNAFLDIVKHFKDEILGRLPESE